MAEKLSSSSEQQESKNALSGARRVASSAWRGCKKGFSACRGMWRMTKEGVSKVNEWRKESVARLSRWVQSAQSVQAKSMNTYRKAWSDDPNEESPIGKIAGSWPIRFIAFTPARLAAIVPRMFEMSRFDVWWSTAIMNKKIDNLPDVLLDLDAPIKTSPKQKPGGEGQPPAAAQ